MGFKIIGCQTADGELMPDIEISDRVYLIDKEGNRIRPMDNYPAFTEKDPGRYRKAPVLETDDHTTIDYDHHYNLGLNNKTNKPILNKSAFIAIAWLILIIAQLASLTFIVQVYLP